MPALPYSSLSSSQQAQVAVIFYDATFGSDPAGYLYELQADGQLSGQRCGLQLPERKTTHARPGSPFVIHTSGPLVLSDQNAQVFARLLLPGLLKDQTPAMAPVVEALSVAAPSQATPSWEQGGLIANG
jgi:hypothetical protein